MAQPPKKPTPPAGVSLSRDQRRPKVPPKGVIDQLAPPVPYESWEDQHSYTPVHPTPEPGSISRVDVDEAVLAIDRRSRETKNAALTTVDRVADLRKETREDIHDLRERLGNTDEKVNTVIEVVGELRETVGKQGGQNELIIDMLKEQKAAREQEVHVKTTARVAEIEIDRTRAITNLEIEKVQQLAVVENDKKDKDLRRELIKTLTLKIVAGIGVLWAFVSAIYMSRCS